MAFNEIKTIESPKFYSDLAYRKSKEGSNKLAKAIFKNKTKEERLKIFYEREIPTYADIIISRLNQIIENFPRTDHLNRYYKELFSLYVDIPDYKKILYKVKWTSNKVEDFKKDYLAKLKKSNDLIQIKKTKKEFEGRVNSLLNKLKNEFNFLRECRKIFLSLPRIKETKTVIIGGFPNVGKSTLLSKLSESKPEISNYPFTTKNLNIGYTDKKLQLIDAPGTLNRTDIMNNIEYQAYLTAKHYGDILLFVFDPTGMYKIEDQIKLFKRFKKEYLKSRVQTIIYLSKTDLISKEQQKEIIEKITESTKEKKIITSIGILKKELEKLND